MSSLNYTGYAKHRGVSQPYISKLVKQGKIPINPDGSIDPVAADAALASVTDPRMDGVRKHIAAKRANGTKGPAILKSGDDSDAATDDRFDLMSQTDAQTAKLRIQAKRETLQYRKEVGELAEISRVNAAGDELGSNIRRAMQRLPDILSTRLAAETDPRKVRAMLAAEIELALKALADGLAALPEQLTTTRQ